MYGGYHVSTIFWASGDHNKIRLYGHSKNGQEEW